jgi:hypothetical protein
MKLHWVIFAAVIISGCDPIDDKLVINNQSNDTIYYAFGSQDDLTVLNEKDLGVLGIKVSYSNYVNILAPKSNRHEYITGARGAWERYINQYCDNGQLKIFVFDIDTLRNYPWEEITSNNKYRYKLNLSVNKLNKSNWIVDLTPYGAGGSK